MKKLFRLYRILLPTLLSVGGYAQADNPRQHGCISWNEILKSDNQSTLEAHLSNKRPYPDNRQAIAPPKGCSVVHTLYVGRHGSRYVTKANKLTKMKDELRTLLSWDEDVGAHYSYLLTEAWGFIEQFIKQLDESVHQSDAAGSITELGKQELEQIARRLASGAGFSSAKLKAEGAIVAMTSGALRTNQSLNAFMDGLKHWSQNDSLGYSPLMANEDAEKLLKSYKFCPKRTSVYWRAKKQLEDARQQIISNTSVSFNFSPPLSHKTLTLEDRVKVAELVYELCQINSNYPSSEQNDVCRYFHGCGEATDLLKLLGTLSNQKQWFKRGFGTGESVMFNLAQPVLNKVVEELSQVENAAESAPVLELWFTHDTAIMALVMLMGYFGDHLTYENWDSDLTAPMSANVQWRVYQCDGENKLQLLLNEQPVCLPDCPEAFCSLSDYLAKTRQKLGMIDFHGECGFANDQEEDE